jgi:hypothetical protein
MPLLTTVPTTVAGVATLLEYAGSDAHEEWQSGDDEDRRETVLSYALRWRREELKAAAFNFVAHVGAALRKAMAAEEGGAA